MVTALAMLVIDLNQVLADLFREASHAGCAPFQATTGANWTTGPAVPSGIGPIDPSSPGSRCVAIAARRSGRRRRPPPDTRAWPRRQSPIASTARRTRTRHRGSLLRVSRVPRGRGRASEWTPAAEEAQNRQLKWGCALVPSAPSPHITPPASVLIDPRAAFPAERNDAKAIHETFRVVWRRDRRYAPEPTRTTQSCV